MPESATIQTVGGGTTAPIDAPAPGFPQAVILLLASCLSVLGAVLLAPVLPKMEDAFEGTSGVDILVPITLTIPALMIGLLSPVAGSIVDRLDRKRLLVGALVLYAVFGAMPLWLDSLVLIVVSRAVVGVTEAAIMTCCTTLIADYFTGPRRAKYLGLQVVFTNVSSIVFFALGGALGNVGWRVPFWLYIVSPVLAVLVALFIWQPHPPAGKAQQGLAPVPWRTLATPCGVTLFGGLVFYIPIAELSFVLDDIGVDDTTTVGLVSAGAAVATAIGALVFGRVSGRGPGVLLPIGFVLAGIGAVVMALGSSTAVVAIGDTIASAGGGLLLPTLLTWAISQLRFEERGRGTGLWTASFNLGQFFCPLLVLALAAAMTGRSSAIVLLGAASVAVSVTLVTALRLRTVEPTDSGG
ncbi:MFS transporter [Streptomyces justiciae]|uniref:MFS transporter n=1 Tax=Streptomyces justiciae TaxID=2780140 RepID=UPI002117C61E|nr:MFS transporter [Streptomyces justiciae]MCW8379768.1 MFS transporter [Streptomyces justiciae]